MLVHAAWSVPVGLQTCTSWWLQLGPVPGPAAAADGAPRSASMAATAITATCFRTNVVTAMPPGLPWSRPELGATESR